MAEQRLAAACAPLAAGDDRAALPLLDEALALDPRHAGAYLHRAVARDLAGDPVGAASDYEESIKTPQDLGPWPVEKCLCSPRLADRVRALAEAKRLGRRAKDQGVALFLKGEREEAARYLDEAIRQYPGDPESYQSRAALREAAGDLQGAVADYEAACRLSEKRASLPGLLLSLAQARRKAAQPAAPAKRARPGA
jgi:Tfp pilus assembly protein PilF